MTTYAETLALYLGAFTDELLAHGVTNVCICPGSRSTPLALTFARHPGIKTWMHLDERSCSYFALGMAKASRQPVAILCTSGSAALNFAPAVAEAYQSGVPLLVLTADRPPELRELGANQTIDQQRLYGSSVKWYAEMLLPEASPAALRHARLTAARAVTNLLGDFPGPVHLNFPFREPLVPAILPPTPPRLAARPLEIAASARGAWDLDLSSLADEVAASRRPLIVCGPQNDPGLPAQGFPVAVSTLAALCRMPLLADPLSQARCGFDPADVVSSYDNFLRDADLASMLEPDLILRFGAQPTSKPLQSFLQRHTGVRQVLVSPDGTWRDPDLTASAILQADPAAFCEALLNTLGPLESRDMWAEETWYCAWADLEQATRTSIKSILAAEDLVSEPGVFHDLAAVIPSGATIFAGNSMPVRDLDSFFPATSKRIRLLANRGTSGIDGVASTALGVAAASGARAPVSPSPAGAGEGAGGEVPTVLVIGDLSFYHDMNGLLAANRFGLSATIVLVNNDGGGIFSFLPQNPVLSRVEGDDPAHFEALFGTPHGLDFAPVAQLYGLGWQNVTTRQQFREALKASFEAPGVQVIEVKTDRVANLKLHQRIWSEVADAVRQVTGR